MYILFINLGDKCDFFFSTQFNNNSNKKKLSNPWVGLGRVGLMWWVGFGWVGFLTHHNGLGQKISSTRPNLIYTPLNVEKAKVQTTFFFSFSFFDELKIYFEQTKAKKSLLRIKYNHIQIRRVNFNTFSSVHGGSNSTIQCRK